MMDEARIREIVREEIEVATEIAGEGGLDPRRHRIGDSSRSVANGKSNGESRI